MNARQERRPTVAAGRLSLAAVCAIFVLLVVPPIFAGLATTFQYGDMVKFHLPQINYLIQHPFDLLHYDATSATTPGHHILFAWVSIVFGYDSVGETDLPIRFLNVLIGVGLVATVWSILYRLSRDVWLAAACTLPIVCSNYVLTASVWINTDNGALLFYALAMYAYLFHAERAYFTALAVLMMVMWRQIYLPVVGAFALPVLLPGDRKKHLVIALATVLPTVIVVAAYANAWGGLTPGTTQQYNKFTLNFSVPLHAVALTGLLATAYSVLLWPTFRALDGRGRQVVGSIAVVGSLLLWTISASTYSAEQGRWGSLIWVLAKQSPAIGDRTIVVLILAFLGVATIAAMGYDAISKKYYPVELMMLLAYFAGYSAQVFAWQRYIEPAIFVTFGVHVARRGPPERRWALLGPLALAGVFGLMSQLRIWGAVGRLFG